MNSHQLLKQQLTSLKLDAISENFLPKAEEYRKRDLDYIDYLSDLVSEQMRRRLERSINYRLRIARFPEKKTIEMFDFEFQKGLNKKEVLSLFNFEFIQQAENVIFLGPPGVGKTHLSISLGIKACELKIRTLFISAAELIEKMRLSQQNNTLTDVIDQLSRYQLLIIDELGYMPVTSGEANLLFQLISRKYERTSIAITTNTPFKEWGKIFNDDIVASAILDRLLHHSHVFPINGGSYRLKEKDIALNKTKE